MEMGENVSLVEQANWHVRRWRDDVVDGEEHRGVEEEVRDQEPREHPFRGYPMIHDII